MFKKIVIVLLIFLISGCSNTNKENDVYISPIKDVFLFDELNDECKEKIKLANNDNEFDNTQFQMLNKDVYDLDLVDIYGNSVNLKNYDKFILEVETVECHNCKSFTKMHIDDCLDRGIQIIQYFNTGNKIDIEQFYEDINVCIPDDVIIIGYDQGFRDYIIDVLKLKYTPSFVSYVDGKVSFNSHGQLSSKALDAYYDISFNNVLTNNDLKDCSGNDLLSLLRDIDDVKNDLSLVNQELIESLDNDDYTSNATYKLMGKSVDYTNISNNPKPVYLSEIDDYSKYDGKDVILLFTYIKDDNNEERISFINELIDSNKSYEYIVVLVEGLESSSKNYNNCSTKFKAPAVSTLGNMPDDFFMIGINKYPTAIFIRNNIFTGVYSNIESVEQFKKASDIFLSENCVALIRNN